MCADDADAGLLRIAYLHFSYCQVCDLNVEHPSEQLISIGTSLDVFIRSAAIRMGSASASAERTTNGEREPSPATPLNTAPAMLSLHSRGPVK